MEEIWVKIVGFENHYEVSSLGRVRSLARVIERMGGKSDFKMSGRSLCIWGSSNGYLNVSLQAGRVRKNHQIHRLVARAFIGESDKDINHKDGNKHNNVFTNLEYVTAKENSAHAVSTGLMKRKGEDNPAAKCTSGQIRRAYKLVSGGYNCAEAAAKVGISVNSVRSACSGTHWKSLGLIPLGKRVNQHR